MSRSFRMLSSMPGHLHACMSYVHCSSFILRLTILQDKLVKVAKKLKKNNVAVDVVAFGSEETNGEKLESFIAAVNSGDNSHLITVPAGTILSDMLFGSPIFQIDGGAGYGAAPGGEGAAGGDAFEFGVDPNMDPELAMALRVSMQEERARQEAATAAAAAAEGTAGEAGVHSASYFALTTFTSFMRTQSNICSVKGRAFCRCVTVL